MIKVHSLKDGRLLFTGGDPRRPLQFIRSVILSEGADGMDPEDVARSFEMLARMVRDTAQDVAQSATPQRGTD